MRSITVAAALVLSVFAFACGGGGSLSASDANSSDVADTTNESADLAASFSQESSSTTAYQTPTPDSGTNRAELVVALEAVAASTTACTSGSASLTPAVSKVASCTNIGNNGSYPGGATLQFNDCTLANGGTLNGTVVVTVGRALSAGASCGPTASIDVTHEVTFTNLSYTSPSMYVLSYPTFDAQVTTTHPIGAAPTLLTLTALTGERTIHGPAGSLILDHQISGSGTVALASSPASRTINGTFTVIHELLHFTAQAVITNLVREETCCKPISGSIAITLAPGTSGSIGTGAVSGTFTYGPTCGDVSLNGSELGVPECI